MVKPNPAETRDLRRANPALGTRRLTRVASGLLREVGEKLGVDAVIEGSVLRAGKRVRVTIQLVRVHPEEHIWAEAYERDLRDVLALHSEVAAAVAREVEARLSGEARRRLESRPRPVEPAAYDQFLRGVALYGQSAYEDAIGHFREAARLDPTFAEPHAWDALACGTVALGGLLGPEIAEGMRDEVERALELDPDLGTAHQAQAYYLQLFGRDWDAAERAYRRALGVARHDPRGLSPYITFLGGLGRFEEALAQADELLRSDPGTAGPHFLAGWVLYKARRFEESVERMEFTLARWPDFVWTHPYLAVGYTFLGRSAEAVAAARRTLTAAPDFAHHVAYGAVTLAREGAGDEAAGAMRHLHALEDRMYVDPFYLAAAYAGLGDRGKALDVLERLVAEGSPSSYCVATEPFFDPFRADPRFRQVLRNLRLPELQF